jgi:hypothetical protein
LNVATSFSGGKSGVGAVLGGVGGVVVVILAIIAAAAFWKKRKEDPSRPLIDLFGRIGNFFLL